MGGCHFPEEAVRDWASARCPEGALFDHVLGCSRCQDVAILHLIQVQSALAELRALIAETRH